MQENNQNNYQNVTENVQNPQIDQQPIAEQQFQPEQAVPQMESQPENPYQGQPYQGQAQFQNPQDQGQGQPQYGGQPPYQGQPYQGQPQYGGQPPYQGQPYQGQPQYGGQPPYPGQYVAPKGPNPFGQLFGKLFSSNPSDAFKVKQNFLSIFLFIGLSILLASLATGGSMRQLNFVKAFFLSMLFFIVIEGLKLGYGILIQGNQVSGKDKLIATLEAMSVSSIIPLLFYVLAFMFAWFWHLGYSFCMYVGIISQIVFFIGGMKTKLDNDAKSNNLFIQAALIFLIYVILTLSINYSPMVLLPVGTGFFF